MFRFPWGDFHSLNLGWFLQKFKELLQDWETAKNGIDGALDAEIQKAEDALTDVFAARDAAAASASAANSSALNASQSSLSSMDARDQSRAARDSAQQAATNAANSATAAGDSATAAGDSATAAGNSASAAAGSATAAGDSATAAGNSATAAGNSASAAAGSATAAGDSATAAGDSATAAGNSASAAADSATAAADSARDAGDAAQSVENSAQQIVDLGNSTKLNLLDNKIVSDIILRTDDQWGVLSGYKFYIFQISPLDTIIFQSNPNNASYYCFLKSNVVNVGNLADLATNSHRTEVAANTNITISAPDDANYIYVAIGTDSTPRTPQSILIGNYNLLESYQKNINNALSESKEYTNTLIKNDKTFTLTATGSYHFKYTLYKDHFYLLENNSQSASINVRSRETIGGANIQDLATQLAHGTHKVVKCTADASYLFVYTTDTMELFVNDLGSIDDSVKLIQSGVVVAADGSGDFDTLRAGIEFATQIPNCTVYVKDGTYNLVSEFATEISAGGSTQYGIALKNGVHIVFSSGALVTAIYEGNNSNVTTYFAPFYADESGGGFTLENLSIIAKNTRYCVHDEFNGADVKVVNKYINCRMMFDNTTAPTDGFPQCIGGGFAKHTYVEIDGCYFKSKRAESQKTPLVSYHNTNRSSDALSYVSVKNSYFDDTYGIFRITYYGDSPDVSTAYLSGNSFGSSPEVAPTGSATVVNAAIVEWNNTIRT